MAALTDTDRRVGQGKPVAPSFLLACVLWQDVKTGWEKRLGGGDHALPALQDAIDDVFERRIGDVSGRGKLAADMREIWVMQPRFEKRAGRVPESMVAQLRFRAGFDFMRLRADIGEVEEALASWWQEYSTADEARRFDLMEQARDEQKPRSRAPVARRVPRTSPAGEGGQRQGSDLVDVQAGKPGEQRDQGGDQEGPNDGGATDAPKKRRRRRRKPTGAGGEPGATSAAQPHSDSTPHNRDE